MQYSNKKNRSRKKNHNIENEKFDLKDQERLLKRKDDAAEWITQKMIAEEFKAVYGDFETKVERVPDHLALSLSKEIDCPFEFAKTSYQIEMDGVLDAKDACKELTIEYDRRKAIGQLIPQTYSHMLNFAIDEGKWIEYLRTTFVKHLEEKIIELSNLETAALGEKSVEKIIDVINERQRIVEGFLLPLMSKYISDHPRCSVTETGARLASSLLNKPIGAGHNALKEGKHQLSNWLSNVLSFLKKFENESPFTKKIYKQVLEHKKEIAKTFETISINALANILIELSPRPTHPAFDESKYVITHVPIPRFGMVGPILVDPIDFLERDIRLSRRRIEDKEDFLDNSIQKTFRSLIKKKEREEKGKKVKLEEVGAELLFEMYQRFNIESDKTPETFLEDILAMLEEEKVPNVPEDKSQAIRDYSKNLIKSVIYPQISQNSSN